MVGERRRKVPLNEQENYWRTVFEHPSVSDVRNPEAVGPVRWNLVNAVTEEELDETIKRMRSSAPGYDRMTVGELKAIPEQNCWHGTIYGCYLDINQSSVEWVRRFVSRRKQAPENRQFITQ